MSTQHWKHKGSKKRRAPVKITHFDPTEVRSRENRMSLGHGYQTLPYDLPTFMYVDRVLSPSKPRTDLEELDGLIGWVITIDCFTKGKQVVISIDKDSDEIITDIREVERLKDVVHRQKKYVEKKQKDKKKVAPPLPPPEDDFVFDDDDDDTEWE